MCILIIIEMLQTQTELLGDADGPIDRVARARWQPLGQYTNGYICIVNTHLKDTRSNIVSEVQR